MERYEEPKDIRSGNFGVAKLVKDKSTGQIVLSAANIRSQILPFHANLSSRPQTRKHPLRWEFNSRLKICDFGYSKIADVWSCGVTLYVMLNGAYPFEDPEDPRNIKKTIQKILSVQYSIPDYIRISKDCRNLLSRIFVADPGERITILEIKTHPWFMKDLLSEFAPEGDTDLQRDDGSPQQDAVEIVRIIQEARTPGDGLKLGGHLAGGSMDLDDIESDADIDVESSGDVVCTL